MIENPNAAEGPGQGPGRYKRLTYDEFRTLYSLGPDVLHHAVVAMGLRGEV